MMANYEIHGYVDEGYESVRRLFELYFSKGIEVNAQLSVYVKERMVVNLCGTSNTNMKKMYITDKRTVPYDEDSLTCVFSCSKVVSAICMATLVDKGLMSYDDEVVKHWPEFGNNDKDKMSITVTNVLRHECGMHKLSETLSVMDLQRENIKKNAVGKVIEKQMLRFPPEESKTKTQYHMYTVGFILNEIFRRVDPQGRTIGEALRQDLSDPLHAAAYIGLTFEELSNSVPMSIFSRRQVLLDSLKPKCMGRKVLCSFNEILKRRRMLSRLKGSRGKSVPVIENMALPSITLHLTSFLMSALKTAELPSANAQASAKGLARIAAMMANKGKIDGKRYLSEATWNILHSDFESRPMYPHNGTSKFSPGGVNLFDTVDDPFEFFKSNDYRKGFVGWLGIGGSTMQWHPVHEIGFAYIPTFLSWEDPSNIKAALLQETVVYCLTEINKRESYKDIINPAFEQE